MQLIGIYIDDATQNVQKSLTDSWYTFGNFPDIDVSLLKTDNEREISTNLKKAIFKNQIFTNELYKLDNETNISINLNCIVGMNGAGKTTLLDILYRILNNFGMLIKGINPNLNKDYNPEWASGINARLYFEVDSYTTKKRNSTKPEFENYTINHHIICIKIKGDCTKKYDASEAVNYVEVTCDGETIENKNEDLQKRFFNFVPYTIATNYSIYTGKDDESSDLQWIDRLYNKNDGYITPIVFAPYKENNTIDISNENKIGKERVMYLSLLMKTLSNNHDFLENYTPFKLVYNLKNEKYYKNHPETRISNYKEELINKLHNKFWTEFLFPITDEVDEMENASFPDEEVNNAIDKKKEIEQIEKQIPYLFSFIEDKWYEYLKVEYKSSLIINYILPYLSFKTIKICLQYENYKSKFDERNIYKHFHYSKNKSLIDNNVSINFSSIITEIISLLAPFQKNSIKLDPAQRDHINLKIYQCINYYEKFKFFSEEDFNHVEFFSSDLIDYFRKENGKKMTYDDVVENIYPSFFNKEMFYKPINEKITDEEYDQYKEKPKILLTEMSSGEQHLYFSLSYAVYHIKNIESVKQDDNRIKYKNINLIFDEAELFYHPEYQRNYIRNILTVLKNSNLDDDLINSINITIITHSPYLISDIPATNILELEKGQIKKNQYKTFCANYYDLLKYQFFLTSTIGGIAQNYINQIIKMYELIKRKEKRLLIEKELNKIKGKDSHKEKELKELLSLLENSITDQDIKAFNAYHIKSSFFEVLIDTIGDPYLNDSLCMMHKYIIENKFCFK